MERYLLSGRSMPSRWQLSHQTLASCTQSTLVYSILDIQKTIFIVFSSNCSFNWWFNERPVLLTDLWGYQQEYMTANNCFLVKKAWPQRIISKIFLIKKFILVMALKKIPQRKCKNRDTDLNSDKQSAVSAPRCKKNFTTHCKIQPMFQSNYIFGLKLFLAKLRQQFLEAKYTQDRKILAFIAFEFHPFKYHRDVFKCHLNVIGLVQGSGGDIET